MLRTSALLCSLPLLLVACGGGEPASSGVEAAAPAQEVNDGWREPSPDGLPTTTAGSPEEVGRYIAVVALCNDCHHAELAASR